MAPSTFTRSEFLVALVVLVVNGLSVLIVDNRRAFFTSLGVALSGGVLMLAALIGLWRSWLNGFTFMVLLGSGLYLPYVAVHTTVFERLIAMTRDRGNLGFLMYVADSVGYLGYAALMMARSALPGGLDFLKFFKATCWVIAALDVREPADELGLLRRPGLVGRADGGQTVMRTTTAAVFRGAGITLEIREFPLPALREQEILVEVLSCTLCGSDLHSLQGRRLVPTPTILGHETLGRIAEFGPTSPRRDASGRPLSVGDRVTWGVVASCGECFYCRRLLPQKCERQIKYGHEPLIPGRELTGGLAGHCVLAPGTAVYVVPEGLSDAAACPANCAGATVAAALEAAGPVAERRVLVMGSGMLGITATAWARARGAEQVVACDIAPARLALAATFGATHLATPKQLASIALECSGGHGVDVAFEMTGSPEAFEAVLHLTRKGGSVILVGPVFPSRPVPISGEQLVRRCLTLRGIHNYAPGHLLTAPPVPCFASPLALPGPRHPLEAADGSGQVLSEPLPPDRLRLGIRPLG